MIRFLNKILVSTPVMGTDATFDKSVILIYEESLQHVAGVILNKPNITTVHEVFRIKGFKTTDFRKDKLFMGGPVNHDHVMLLNRYKANLVCLHLIEDLLVLLSDD